MKPVMGSFLLTLIYFLLSENNQSRPFVYNTPTFFMDVGLKCNFCLFLLFIYLFIYLFIISLSFLFTQFTMFIMPCFTRPFLSVKTESHNFLPVLFSCFLFLFPPSILSFFLSFFLLSYIFSCAPIFLLIQLM